MLMSIWSSDVLANIEIEGAGVGFFFRTGLTAGTSLASRNAKNRVMGASSSVMLATLMQADLHP